MNDFTRCPGCRLIRPEGEGLCPSCLGQVEPQDICQNCAKLEACDSREPGAPLTSGCSWFEPVLSNPDPDPEPFRPAEAYRPDPRRGEAPAQSVLPMPDAGPLFAGCPEVRR